VTRTRSSVARLLCANTKQCWPHSLIYERALDYASGPTRNALRVTSATCGASCRRREARDMIHTVRASAKASESSGPSEPGRAAADRRRPSQPSSSRPATKPDTRSTDAVGGQIDKALTSRAKEVTNYNPQPAAPKEWRRWRQRGTAGRGPIISTDEPPSSADAFGFVQSRSRLDGTVRRGDPNETGSCPRRRAARIAKSGSALIQRHERRGMGAPARLTIGAAATARSRLEGARWTEFDASEPAVKQLAISPA